MLPFQVRPIIQLLARPPTLLDDPQYRRPRITLKYDLRPLRQPPKYMKAVRVHIRPAPAARVAQIDAAVLRQADGQAAQAPAVAQRQADEVAELVDDVVVGVQRDAHVLDEGARGLAQGVEGVARGLEVKEEHVLGVQDGAGFAEDLPVDCEEVWD